MTGIFPSVLKIAKVVLVFRKDSKLDYSNYCPISLLSNIEKILACIYTYISIHRCTFTHDYAHVHAIVKMQLKKCFDA